jgi:acetyl-CoA carboxylase beta subunit
MIQSESFNEIRDYLIHLNNEHRAMKKTKDKESMIKVRTTKQVIFADEISKIFYRKIEVTRSVKLSNSCDAILTSVKDTDLQADNCFLCHKLSHISRKYSDQSSRINALDDEDEFDHFFSESDSDSKTSHLFKSH